MGTYTPQAGDALIPGAQAVTELLSPVGGFIAGCGEAALAVITGLVSGTPVGPAQVSQIIADAIKHGAGPGGVSTPAELTATAADYGVTLQSYNYNTALNTFAGVKPIELGVSNASAFGGADANVQGHYITVVGRTTSGAYIVSDPNTAQSKVGQFVTYTAQQIANARPFWAGVPTQSVQSSGGGVTIPGVQGISDAINGFRSGATTALHQTGWFLIALTICGFGAWLLFEPQIQQAAAAVKDTAGKAAEVAALA